jgi:hypothetical protein
VHSLQSGLHAISDLNFPILPARFPDWVFILVQFWISGLKSWVAEGSRDRKSWVEIDRKTDNEIFKNSKLRSSTELETPCPGIVS